MKNKKRLIFNIAMIFLGIIGFILILPWIDMWIQYTSLGVPDLTYIEDITTIILYRNLFLLGGLLISIAVVLMIIINFFIVFIHNIE